MASDGQEATQVWLQPGRVRESARDLVHGVLPLPPENTSGFGDEAPGSEVFICSDEQEGRSLG